MQGFKTKINMELELLVDLLVSMEVATLFSESSRQAYRFPLRAKKDLISIMETFKEFKTASSKLLAVYKPILTKINSLNTDPSRLSRKDLPVKEGTWVILIKNNSSIKNMEGQDLVVEIIMSSKRDLHKI